VRQRNCAALLLCGPLVAGCGTAKRIDFIGHSRPASPVQVSVYVSDRKVQIDPSSVGAGLVTFDVTNQARRAVALWLAGTGGNCTLGTSGPVPAGQTAQFTAQVPAGAYTIGPCRSRGAPGATSFKLASLTVGPHRRTGNDALSQP